MCAGQRCASVPASGPFRHRVPVPFSHTPKGIAMSRIALPMLALSLSFAFPIQAAEPRTGQGKAVAKVNKLGGRVTIDEKDPDKPVIGIDLTATLITDAGLDGLKALTRLQRLALGGTRVTDAGLERLKTLRGCGNWT